MKDEISRLELTAAQIRGRVIEMSAGSRTPHLGSALSCVDILVALYFSVMRIDPERPGWECRDRFILSKGHAAAALYATLARRGYFAENLLDSFASSGSVLEEHPSFNCVAGVEATTGSLGHGLPIGTGMALAGQMKGVRYRVFCLLSDGECNEGSVWEAAMFAAAKRIGNLVAVVDFNKWQATGRSCEVMALEPLEQKWKSFGWDVYRVGGNDMGSLLEVFEKLGGKREWPAVVIADTVKGKGVSFMEDDNNWHYRIPTADEVEIARRELGLV